MNDKDLEIENKILRENVKQLQGELNAAQKRIMYLIDPNLKLAEWLDYYCKKIWKKLTKS